MASSTRIELAVLSALTALWLAAPAWAAGGAEQRAKAFALEGKKAFDTNDFATAISKYEEAYRIKPAPGLLFNLGQSHRKLGNHELALSYFRRYLESNPPEAQAKAVETVMAQVEAEKKAAGAAAAEKKALAEREERERKEKEAARQAIELEKSRTEAARAEAEAAQRKLELERSLKEAPVAEAPQPVYKKWWFWGAVGVVVAGAVGTSVYVATAPQPARTTFPDINAR